jgi:hypothetical protein
VIVIPLNAAEGIDWALHQTERNPYHYPAIVTALRSTGYHDTAEWIDANPHAYVQGVTQGFIIDLQSEEHEELTAT